MDLVFSSWQDIPFTENHIKQLQQILLRYSEKDTWHRGNYKTNSNSVAAFDETGAQICIVFQTASPFDSTTFGAGCRPTTNTRRSTVLGWAFFLRATACSRRFLRTSYPGRLSPIGPHSALSAPLFSLPPQGRTVCSCLEGVILYFAYYTSGFGNSQSLLGDSPNNARPGTLPCRPSLPFAQTSFASYPIFCILHQRVWKFTIIAWGFP
jgi:hypothetical protein